MPGIRRTSHRFSRIALAACLAACAAYAARAQTAAPPDDVLRAQVVCGRQRAYVGQRLALELRVLVRPASWGTQTLDAGTMLRSLRLANLAPFEANDSPDLSETEIAAGEPRRYVYTWHAEYVPEHTGRIVFPHLEVQMNYPTATGAVELHARASGPDIDVLPVPIADQPDGYAGAVGLFNMETRATPTRTRVGDPIDLTIDVYGDGMLALLPPPPLSFEPQLARDFLVQGAPLTGEVVDATRRFHVTLRARRADVTAIPSLRYPYFDPDAERFVIVSTPAIPLEVAPAPAVPTRAPESALATPDTAPAHPTRLAAQHGFETQPTRLLTRPARWAPAASFVLWLAPPAVALTLWLIGRVRALAQRLSPHGRRRRAARRARRTLLRIASAAPADQPAHIAALLSDYCAQRFGTPPGASRGTQLAGVLRAAGVSAPAAERCAALSRQCEAIAFARGTVLPPPALAAEAAACVRLLDETTP